jgi:hypothetical protein
MPFAQGFAVGFQAVQSLQERLDREKAIAQDRIFQQEAEHSASAIDEAIRASKRPVIELRAQYEAKLAEGDMDPQEEMDWHRRIHNAATMAMQSEFDVANQLLSRFPGNPYIKNIATQRAEHVIERYKAASMYAQNTLNTLVGEQAQEGAAEGREMEQERWEEEGGLRSAQEDALRAQAQRNRSLSSQQGTLDVKDRMFFEQNANMEWSQLDEKGQKEFWAQEQAQGRIPKEAGFNARAALSAYRANRWKEFESGSYEYPEIEVDVSPGTRSGAAPAGEEGWSGAATRRRGVRAVKEFVAGGLATAEWVNEFLGLTGPQGQQEFAQGLARRIGKDEKVEEIVGVVLQSAKSKFETARSGAYGEAIVEGTEEAKARVQDAVGEELSQAGGAVKGATKNAIQALVDTAVETKADTTALLSVIGETLGQEAADLFATILKARQKRQGETGRTKPRKGKKDFGAIQLYPRSQGE